MMARPTAATTRRATIAALTLALGLIAGTATRRATAAATLTLAFGLIAGATTALAQVPPTSTPAGVVVPPETVRRLATIVGAAQIPPCPSPGPPIFSRTQPLCLTSTPTRTSTPTATPTPRPSATRSSTPSATLSSTATPPRPTSTATQIGRAHV